MGKNYNQSKKAKEEFLKGSAIALYMRGDASKVYTREDLAETFNMSDRSIREKVSEIANYLPVIALTDSKGYRILCFNEETTIEEFKEMYEDAQHQINDFKSRIDNLKARMKPLVAFMKVIEKKFNEQ